ncbi:MAG: NAD-dependent succinate-semialdehyde dehydrogenase [Burkholderiaceae bacterium]
MSLPPFGPFIAGRWLAQGSGGTRPVINPADETVIGELPLVGVAELRQAADVAREGFRVWRSRSALERAQVLRRAAELMRQRADAIAQALTREQGKPIAEAKREVTLSADIIDFQADEARRLYGRTVPPRVEGILSHTVLRQPLGPVAAFTAWNFPVNLASRKLGSALAAGCSVVLKAAEEAPGSVVALVHCLLDAGLPAEALQLVFGDPPTVAATLIEHPAIRKVSITGSVAVGRQLAEACARHGKRFTGELGGHAPVIVCADAALGPVLKLSVPAKFRNAGQVCASPIRFFVHASLYERFVREFVAAAQALRLGPGSDAATQMGPLAHARRLDDMARFVSDAREQGARVLCGGQRAPRKGWFFEPTVIVDAPPQSRVMTVEPFGPIAVIAPFDSLDDAIARANELPYALGAYAFTRDLATAHHLGEQIEAGMVGINHYGVSQPELPFGGWKDSGTGQEMGPEGLLPYTELKTITVGSPD